MSITREELRASARKLFWERYSCEPEVVVAAPGRSNIIGEHTDYNDGHVLPIAIDRFTVAVARNRQDRQIRVYTGNLDESFTFDLDAVPGSRPTWASYLMGVAVEMDRAGYRLRGKDVVILGNVPIGSGLSSSAAFEVAFGTAIERLDGHSIPDAEFVDICRRGDHRFVGVKCGPMDQYAARACRKDHAGLLDCRSLVMTHYPIPLGLAFVSIYSGIPRALAGSEYNERLESCQKAVKILQRRYPEVKALRDATVEMVEELREEMGDRVYRRARHVVTEQKRVQEMVRAFESGDLAKMGELLREGHFSLSRDYEVSLPVLDQMVEWLYEQPGVVGARLTGAGFGGSLICVVREKDVDLERLKARFLDAFRERTPDAPEMWLLKTENGAKYSDR